MADTVVSNAPTDVAERASHFRYLEWGPVIAGALGTAAIAFVLFTFGSALGLSAVSPYPYSGLSGAVFMIVAALFAALVQVVSYAAGGYLAGRMRSPWTDGTEGERHFRDGAHGFAVWALGLLFTAAVLASGASGVVKSTVEATSAVAGASANAATELSTEPVEYATDLLLRTGPESNAQGGTIDREPIARIFMAALKNGSLSERDRTYLAQVVARQTGVAEADAQRRVDEAYAEAKNAEQKARDAADKARKAAALAAFLTAATLAIACAAACTAAGFGGRDRDQHVTQYWLGAKRFW